MSEIKCLENYKQLKESLAKGEKGDTKYFTSKLNISPRTFFRLLKYLQDIENIKVIYNKTENRYYLE